MSYEIKDIDVELLDKIEKDWSLGYEEVFSVSLSDMFAGMRINIQSDKGETHKPTYKVVFDEDSSKFIAIIMFTVTDFVNLTKLLNVNFSPESMENLDSKSIANIYLKIILESFKIALNKDHKVKIFGRDDTFVKVLELVEMLGGVFSKELEFKMLKRWLIIKKI